MPKICSKIWTISLFRSLTRPLLARTLSKLSSSRQEQTRFQVSQTGPSLLATVSYLTKLRETSAKSFLPVSFPSRIKNLERQAPLSTTSSITTQLVLHKRLTAGNLVDKLVFSSLRPSRPRLTAMFLLSRPRNSSEEAWAHLLQLCFLL